MAAAQNPDIVELAIPVPADLVVLARLTAATVASRAGFAVEEIEDLRLAVEELCLSLVPAVPSGRLRLTFCSLPDEIEITCLLEETPATAANGAQAGAGTDELSLRILDALVDAHGRDSTDGLARAWLRKRRVGVTTD
jgi:hypothetical protein